MRWAYCVALALAASAIGTSSAAFAAFTTINNPYFANEDKAQQIFVHLYGGAFAPTGTDNLSYTNGTITATRIEDIYQPAGDPAPALAFYNGPINDDQVWQGEFELASANVVFAGYHEEFGYFDGASGGSYVNLFNASGTQYSVTGSADLSGLSGHTLRWARGGEGRVFSSKISDNQDQLDHMVTWQINGLNDGKLTWLVMWEDKLPGEPFADYDYNDLVVQIKALPQAVPEPATAAMSMLGLITLTGARRRKR